MKKLILLIILTPLMGILNISETFAEEFFEVKPSTFAVNIRGGADFNWYTPGGSTFLTIDEYNYRNIIEEPKDFAPGWHLGGGLTFGGVFTLGLTYGQAGFGQKRLEDSASAVNLEGERVKAHSYLENNIDYSITKFSFIFHIRPAEFGKGGALEISFGPEISVASDNSHGHREIIDERPGLQYLSLYGSGEAREEFSGSADISSLRMFLSISYDYYIAFIDSYAKEGVKHAFTLSPYISYSLNILNFDLVEDYSNPEIENFNIGLALKIPLQKKPRNRMR